MGEAQLTARTEPVPYTAIPYLDSLFALLY
jgi:hypothetical protein